MSFLLKKIKQDLQIYCPLCNVDYKPNNMRTVEDNGESILLHSQCPKCSGAVLSLLYSDFLGVTLIGIATDLDYNDAVKFKHADSVTEDDILEIYQLLLN